jgi:hypothetical protein
MASYTNASFYRNTPSFDDRYLDVLVQRTIPKLPDDILFTITPTYEFRPDNLAYDLYGNANLWWVFAVRNKNTLIDPIYDFKSGVRIYLPKKSSLTQVLGI